MTAEKKMKINYSIFFILLILTSVAFMSYYTFSLHKTDNGWELGKKDDESFVVDITETDEGIVVTVHENIRDIDDVIPMIYLSIPFLLLFFGLAIHYYHQIPEEQMTDKILKKYKLK